MGEKNSHCSSLKARVAHAYYNYGRFCSSHPVACLVMSILTMLFLASPLTRFSFASSSPLDIYWSDNVSEALSSKNRPDWLRNPPRVLIQQIMVRAKVDPWDPRKLDVNAALKGPLSRAFTVHEKVRDFTGVDGTILEDACISSHMGSGIPLLPSHGCLLLSPALFWDNDIESFFREKNVMDRIFSSACTRTMCPRDLLFGLPTSETGVNKQYRTNRQRTIQFAITTALHAHDKTDWDELIEKLGHLPGFKIVEEDKSEKHVHIFYRSRKGLREYLPLALSYCLLFLYLYFSLSKIKLVKSQRGLAISAVVTVASSLVVAAGICHYFELTPTIWGVEWLPYMAMVLGIENTLCITRSVVLTNVNWDVRKRIAYGLSREGFSITKNFLTEILIVTIGFFTFIPEIQEFCAFSFIGLVVDFYMQLFFYAPCLTFDMLRMAGDPELKQRVELRHLATVEGYAFTMNEDYPAVTCPIANMFPSYFVEDTEQAGEESLKARLYRVKSESNGLHNKTKTSATLGHKRAASNTTDFSIPVEPRHVVRVPFPKRLKIMKFMAKTRFFNRIFMVATVLWIVWLAFIVHQMNILDRFLSPSSLVLGTTADPSSAENSPDLASLPRDDRAGSSAPLEWGSWQRKTFKWWPALFDNYNMSLSQQYITLLPPVIFDVLIPPDDPAITFSGSDQSNRPVKAPSNKISDSLFPPELRLRISWLELQMTIVLIVSIGIFSTVAAFIIYVCFSGRGSYGHLDEDLPPAALRKHKRAGSRAVVETLPMIMSGHRESVVFMSALGEERIVSSCLGGEIRVWDSTTGECIRNLQRKQPTERLNGLSGTAGSALYISTDQTSGNGHRREEEFLRRRRNQAQPQQWQPAAFVAPNSYGPQLSNTSTGYDFNRYVQPTAPPVQQSANTDDRPNSILFRDLEASEEPAAIWSLGVVKCLIVAGCADGSVELLDVNSGVLRGKYKNSTQGVTHVTVKGTLLILSRIGGILEIVNLKLAPVEEGTEGQDPCSRRVECHLVKALRAHQLQINCLGVSGTQAITGSADHSLKIFDLRNCSFVRTLYGHNAAVNSMTIDHVEQLLFSCCIDGIIISWDLAGGQILKTFSESSSSVSGPISIATTSSMLLGCRPDGHLLVWEKHGGSLITWLAIKSTDELNNNHPPPFVFGSPLVIALGEFLAVTSHEGRIQLWDLQRKSKLRDLKLGAGPCSDVEGLILLSNDSLSVACSKADTVYRINFPIIKVK